MHYHLLFFCFVLSHLVAFPLAMDDSRFHHPDYQPFDCGYLGPIRFPFTNKTTSVCGLYRVKNCNQPPGIKRKIQLKNGGIWFDVDTIFQANIVHINDSQLQQRIHSRDCSILSDLALPTSPFSGLSTVNNLTLFHCSKHPKLAVPLNVSSFSCPHYYTKLDSSSSITTLPNCSRIVVPVSPLLGPQKTSIRFTADFQLQVKVNFHCRGQCETTPEGNFNCRGGITIKSTIREQKARIRKNLMIALGVGVPGVVLISLVGLWYCRKRCAAPNTSTRNISSSPYSKSDLEDGNVYFEVPVFSYGELEMATNEFDRDRELGHGGFGTVYYGKLHDGREVAVKRFYQHNYKRVEQFMNEVKILTRLRHKNLVSLYGCTSSRSRELLLVYEFIPNGTVADHLHGEGANSSSLTWPIRMNIAIETASALVYLHTSDIIHRDVKTNNILLDNNFSVKVADFGLSRLFPDNVSHVSTAPQGTPGYVDPEYHQYYQLTSKSDVYSFGVVLIELISSMPAVDITRHRHEINLSNLAINKILKQEVDELIDPCLGFQSDNNVRQMIMAVAALAFQCLQQDKETRPTMEEALETLKRIESGVEERENVEENNVILLESFESAPSPECN